VQKAAAARAAAERAAVAKLTAKEAKAKASKKKALLAEAKRIQVATVSPLANLLKIMADGEHFNTLPPYVRDPMAAAFARLTSIESEVSRNILREEPTEHSFVAADLKKEFAAITTLAATATGLIKAQKTAVLKMNKP
jgi:hypothetical protein